MTRFANEYADKVLDKIARGERYRASLDLDGYNRYRREIMPHENTLWDLISEENMPGEIFDACCAGEEAVGRLYELTIAWGTKAAKPNTSQTHPNQGGLVAFSPALMPHQMVGPFYTHITYTPWLVQ